MQTGSPLRIEQEVTIQEALEDLGRLPSRKAHGPDGIPNEALKACREEIAPTIAELANVSFEVGHFPSTFRRTTTVVLQKEGKKDYSLPGSYRPIALENTLSKVVEGFVTTQITCARGAQPPPHVRGEVDRHLRLSHYSRQRSIRSGRENQVTSSQCSA
jgi:hypothetical protein